MGGATNPAGTAVGSGSQQQPRSVTAAGAATNKPFVIPRKPPGRHG
jgi:hypothetical protein